MYFFFCSPNIYSTFVNIPFYIYTFNLNNKKKEEKRKKYIFSLHFPAEEYIGNYRSWVPYVFLIQNSLNDPRSLKRLPWELKNHPLFFISFNFFFWFLRFLFYIFFWDQTKLTLQEISRENEIDTKKKEKRKYIRKTI